MGSMMAYCGLPCDTCPIHLATLEPDDLRREALRADIARSCREEYGLRLEPADITDCDGCRSGERLFSGCADCRIRPCAAGRGLESCASCDDYPCDALEEHFARDPAARARLELLRPAVVGVPLVRSLRGRGRGRGGGAEPGPAGQPR
jgi:hypothetical protein